MCGDDVSAKEGLLLRWSAVCVDDVSAKEGLLLRWSAVCVGMMCQQRRVFS